MSVITPAAFDSITLHEKFISVHGCRIRYLSAGSGPPLVFIHGLLGYAFSWRFNLPVLAQRFTVYALDLPGVGFSERTARPQPGLAPLASCVLGFLKKLNILNPVLVGSSHGGAIAVMAAAHAPEEGLSIPKLVLVSPVNPWSRQGAGRAAFLGSAIGGALLRCAGPVLRFTHSYFLRRMYGDPCRIADGTLEGYDCALRPGGTLEHMLSRVRRWSSDLDEVERLLPAIADIPTLLIWGSKDRAVPLSSARLLISKLNNAELAVIEGAGHLPYEEVPQPFNELVLRFLLSEATQSNAAGKSIEGKEAGDENRSARL